MNMKYDKKNRFMPLLMAVSMILGILLVPSMPTISRAAA